MPWRPRNLWRAYQNLSRRDPTALVFAFAIYAIFSGLTLILPGDSFDVTPIYALARELGIPERMAGLGMLLDAMALLACLGWQFSPPVRSMVGISTGMAWFFWGGLLVGAGWQVGYFTPSGAWLMVVSIVVMQATAGWAHPPMQPVLEGPPSWS